MMLVPETELSRLKKLEESKMDENSLQAFKLEEEIAKLLQQKGLSEEAKSELYTELLRKFLVFRGKNMQDAVPPPINDKNSSVQDSQDNPGSKTAMSTPLDTDQYDTEDVLQVMPDKFKGRAQGLLNLLKKQPTLRWNSKGEIVYRGKTVHGSHVTDLIRGAIIPKAKKDIVGSDIFTKALSEMNLPQGILSNKAFCEKLIRAKSVQRDLSPTQPTHTPQRTPTLKEKSTPRRKSKGAAGPLFSPYVKRLKPRIPQTKETPTPPKWLSVK